MKIIFLLISFVIAWQFSFCQEQNLWHGIEREVRYKPDGNDFVIVNGNRRFTRALYGTNTAFRAEAGDLPEFALYMPGMGGNIKFGLSNSDTSKWLINADKITARYRPGSMLYDIEDKMLGNGKLHLVILAMGDAEGIIIKLHFENVKEPVKLVWAYGGASGKKFSRDGDMAPDPESSFYLKPDYCTDNNYSTTGNTADTLLLKNPETWWPIEQDYMDDGFAFSIDAARPVRIHLKTGKIVSDYDDSIAAYNGKMIDGGAATVLDLPLNKNKELKNLVVKTIANDVVIGLMAVTLLR